MEKMLRPALTLSLLLTACAGTESPGSPGLSLADTGPGSLRDALSASRDGDTLRFTTSGTVSLTSPLILSKDVTILASPGVTVTLEGDGTHRILEIQEGAEVVLDGLTLQNGSAPATTPQRVSSQAEDPSLSYGGLVRNAGVLTILSGTLTAGTAHQGGAIVNLPGATLTVAGGTLTGNTATARSQTPLEGGNGGAIYNMGTLNITGGTLTENSAFDTGGAVASDAGATLTMSGGEISNNLCTMPISADQRSGCAGGGIYAYGDVILSGGTISGNMATLFGGGVVVLKPDASTPVNLVVSGAIIENNQVGAAGDIGSGGGVATNAALRITGGTIQGNRAREGAGVTASGGGRLEGGAIQNNVASFRAAGLAFGDSTFTMTGGLIAGNRAPGNAAGVGFLSQGVFNMEGGVIRGNVSGGEGGGVGFNGTFNFRNGTIENNTAVSGAGIRVFSTARLNMTGGTITGNQASVSGGGIRTSVGGVFNQTGGTVTGNTPDNIKND